MAGNAFPFYSGKLGDKDGYSDLSFTFSRPFPPAPLNDGVRIVSRQRSPNDFDKANPSFEKHVDPDVKTRTKDPGFGTLLEAKGTPLCETD